MGVSGLWSLLSPVKKEIRLSECKGKRLAVDLSAWIVQCSSVSTNVRIPKPYLCCRGIFFRTLSLLELGISLVFVLDGPHPPALKHKKKREEFYQISLQYKDLLIAMGVPVIETTGEAEKMCAELDRQNIVDGVLTNDGDVFIYGAQTVYKGLFTEKKEQLAYKYQMADIREHLGFSQKDLVAFILLSGGDICTGVPTVGVKKFEELMKEFKKNNIVDALGRLETWRYNSELCNLTSEQKSLVDIVRGKHCSRCSHEGTKQQHNRRGCELCHSDINCLEKNTNAATVHPLCKCAYHNIMEKIKPYEIELKVRELAIKKEPNFPVKAVINEFLDMKDVTIGDTDATLRMPDYLHICEILMDKLNYSYAETMKHLVPATIKMALHGLLPHLNPKPLSILKACKHNYESCYMVRWQKLDLDNFTDSSNSYYDFPVPAELLTLKYPDLVAHFKSTHYKRAISSDEYKKQKAKKNADQSEITSFYKVLKKPSQQIATQSTCQ